MKLYEYEYMYYEIIWIIIKILSRHLFSVTVDGTHLRIGNQNNYKIVSLNFRKL
jgi:hypothetical protein